MDTVPIVKMSNNKDALFQNTYVSRKVKKNALLKLALISIVFLHNIAFYLHEVHIKLIRDEAKLFVNVSMKRRKITFKLTWIFSYFET